MSLRRHKQWHLLCCCSLSPSSVIDTDLLCSPSKMLGINDCEPLIGTHQLINTRHTSHSTARLLPTSGLSVLAPRRWNKLPVHVRTDESLSHVFKRHLNTQLSDINLYLNNYKKSRLFIGCSITSQQSVQTDCVPSPCLPNAESVSIASTHIYTHI